MIKASCNLFVYGTLRRFGTLPMAALLHEQCSWAGTARARGHLYALEGYPGFAPDPQGRWVTGDLFALLPHNAGAILAALDAYEECSADFPKPHEYQRSVIEVALKQGTTSAWTYVYALPTVGLRRIDSGDFLAAQL